MELYEIFGSLLGAFASLEPDKNGLSYYTLKPGACKGLVENYCGGFKAATKPSCVLQKGFGYQLSER